jgi:hypothetical protein
MIPVAVYALCPVPYGADIVFGPNEIRNTFLPELDEQSHKVKQEKTTGSTPPSKTKKWVCQVNNTYLSLSRFYVGN